MRTVFALLLTLSLATVVFAIPRDAQEKAEFRKANPCPSTGAAKGGCPGHQIDHKKALMNGGKDKPKNMQWIGTEAHKAKTKQDFTKCKDSYSCKHKTAKKRLPWEKKKKAKQSKAA